MSDSGASQQTDPMELTPASDLAVGPTRVMLVDDHELVRSALASLLDREDDVEVICTASDGAEAVEVATDTAPDVVVMDVSMPGLSAFEATRAIQRRCPNTRVLFLSAYPHDCHLRDSLTTAASGFLTKDQPYPELLAAIRTVAREASPGPESTAQRAGAERGRKAPLSEREREVLRSIAQGYSKKEIASMLGISVRTVDAHARNLMGKLAIHDRVGLARYAIREGLTPLDS